MKKYIVGFLLMASTSVMAKLEIVEGLNQGGRLVGVVKVGVNKGATCSLTVEAIQRDLFSHKYETRYTEQVHRDGRWIVLKSQVFPIQNYSGDYQGSVTHLNGRVPLKTVLNLFYDSNNQAYKAMLQVNGVGENARINTKFTICEGMINR